MNKDEIKRGMILRAISKSVGNFSWEQYLSNCEGCTKVEVDNFDGPDSRTNQEHVNAYGITPDGKRVGLYDFLPSDLVDNEPSENEMAYLQWRSL